MREKIITHSILLAQPGWYVAHYLATVDGEADEIYLEPIIAFEIRRTEGPYHPSVKRPPADTLIHHDVVPITLDGNLETTTEEWAVKSPDGKYTFPCDATCDDEAAALNHFRRRREDPNA